jgi:hypothetical protein
MRMTGGRLFVEVSADGLEARLRINPGPPCGREALDAALRTAGVVHGIDETAVTAVAAALADERYAAMLPVARGQVAQHGESGYLKPHFELVTVCGAMRDDGSFDYHDRGQPVTAQAGTPIATYVPGSKGIPGRRVDGRAIPATDGVERLPKLGRGVERLPNQQIVARSDGVVVWLEGSTLDVVNHWQHRGDVDLRSGNLQIAGSLTVEGSVQQDCAAVATGDVLVKGGLDGGAVRAGGNVVVRGGVLGPTAVVRCGGDATCRHVTGGTLHAVHDVYVTENAVHSCLRGRRILADGRRGRILGGEALALERIVVRDAGAPAATPTLLAVAQVDAVYDSGTGDDRSSGRRRSLRATEKELLARAEIVVKGQLQPGVVIRFSTYELVIEQPAENVTFRFDSEQTKIVTRELAQSPR